MARADTAHTDAAADEGEPTAERPGAGEGRFRGGWRDWRDWRGPGTWRRGLVLAVLAVLLGVVLALHARVPNAVGNLGSLVETFLPWFGLGVPVLLGCALLRRSMTALAALLLPAVVWTGLFGGLLTAKSSASGDGRGDLTVLTHNVDAGNADPQGTAEALVASEVDILALEELPAKSTGVYERALAEAYPYHVVKGTIGVWSRYPLSDSAPVDIKIGWTRALRTTVDAPGGKVAVFAAHLPSVRVKLRAGFTAGQRDDAAEQLGRAIAREPLEHVVLLGDLNGTMNDRALAPVTAQMRSTQGAAGDGFGFSWPASFPMARIDQIMVRGLEPVASWSLPSTGSDHLPVAASVRL
ncbi:MULTISPECIES: endonuclease/exonuclease/phosphatase family protein [unclassified Streptomyces]|uniref:endonuclease/exonuclease/phosphatase family protein n=1 Tax=unclassified Streptomyces TaxID=2593676 RepID=UPI0022B7233A|nr:MULTISPECIES: endonuclease/exonuclease/phosphatase family protein [unclassified Streptomyces]MCZ7413993.1 endonuclease/exonuclease/phosphatase family protein [Streptomyces sp. WMMC897]MCZ7430988.1 endonuclease/exonuclease/phosphatase family protein [Streptomyces sp. WMMC1477]